VGGDEAREVTGEWDDSTAPEAVLESTDPAGEADRPPLDAAFWVLPTTLGILFPINPLFSDTFRAPPTIPAVLGSRLGRRLPINPLRTEEDG